VTRGKEGSKEKGGSQEIRSVGKEGPFGGVYAGKPATLLIIDDVVFDSGDHGALAQINRARLRDDLLDSCSAKALCHIRGRST
jgi:hypothetical protein